MRHRADKRMSTAQHRYKKDYESRLGATTSLKRNQLVYVDCPPLTTIAADRMAFESYSKLLSKNLGPYRVLSSTAHGYNP